ncbi:MAG: hypothetical protein F6K24_21785 [Okeania sp. SIO2D1]|nr:hypothetical protein [Okeania sp. SIO2D1]
MEIFDEGKTTFFRASQNENVCDFPLTTDGWNSLMMKKKWIERSLSNTLSFSYGKKADC